ncbi:unnamed protein product [Rhizopus stolonifer]
MNPCLDIEKKAFEMLNVFMKDKPHEEEPSTDYHEQRVPEALEVRLDRMSKQNIKLISSEMTVYLNSHTFQVKGSTGQIYKVTVGPRLQCTCRDHISRATHCKHILYILLKELKVLDLKLRIYETLYPSNQELKDIFLTYHPTS